MRKSTHQRTVFSVFIRLAALGDYIILVPRGLALTQVGRLLFSQHLQKAKTFFRNNKTRDNKFILFQQD